MSYSDVDGNECDGNGKAMPEITVHICNRKCEHDWSGPMYESEDGLMSSRQCAKCGRLAIDVDMWEGP